VAAAAAARVQKIFFSRKRSLSDSVLCPPFSPERERERERERVKKEKRTLIFAMNKIFKKLQC